MKRSIQLTAALAAAALLTAAAPAAAADATAESVPETMQVNLQASHPGVEGLPEDKRTVEDFTHGKHARQYLPGTQEFSKFPFTDDFTCAACHHTSSTPEAITSCLDCKNVDSMFEAVGGKNKAKEIYHQVCNDCHKAMEKAEKTTGPTRCNGCHG